MKPLLISTSQTLLEVNKTTLTADETLEFITIVSVDDTTLKDTNSLIRPYPLYVKNEKTKLKFTSIMFSQDEFKKHGAQHLVQYVSEFRENCAKFARVYYETDNSITLGSISSMFSQCSVSDKKIDILDTYTHVFSINWNDLVALCEMPALFFMVIASIHSTSAKVLVIKDVPDTVDSAVPIINVLKQNVNEYKYLEITSFDLDSIFLHLLCIYHFKNKLRNADLFPASHKFGKLVPADRSLCVIDKVDSKDPSSIITVPYYIHPTFEYDDCSFLFRTCVISDDVNAISWTFIPHLVPPPNEMSGQMVCALKIRGSQTGYYCRATSMTTITEIVARTDEEPSAIVQDLVDISIPITIPAPESLSPLIPQESINNITGPKLTPSNIPILEPKPQRVHRFTTSSNLDTKYFEDISSITAKTELFTKLINLKNMIEPDSNLDNWIQKSIDHIIGLDMVSSRPFSSSN